MKRFTHLNLVLGTVALIVLLLVLTPAYAREVPFTTGHTIDGNFNGTDIATADMDGDGDLDVLGAAENTDEIAWWENTAGDGSAWSKQIVDSDFDDAQAVAAADVDGDGDMDILGAAFQANDITWWENTKGDGSAWYKRSVDSSFFAAWEVVAADVDGDGDMDVLGVGYEQSKIVWWENLIGDGSAWSKHTVTTDLYHAYGIAAADMDGDGDLDVLGATGSGAIIAWWENTAGNGSAWSKHSVDSSFDTAYVVDAADVDGDGDLDILGVLSDDDITWWENTAGNGSAWSKHPVVGSFSAASDVAGADVDGDGDLDILGAAWSNEIGWLENTAGDGSAWSKHSVVGYFGGAAGVAAADVDGDGDLDILGAAQIENDITWWENETIHRSALYPTAGEMAVAYNFDGANSVAAADLDGDGDLDVLGAAFYGDEIAWVENTAGDGSAWRRHIVAGSFDGARDVAAADVDGDGDLDILGAAFNADDITWWENIKGDGSDWSKHSVDTVFSGANSVAAADLDGDGDLDILGTATWVSAITWWENTAGDGSAWSEHTLTHQFLGASDVAAADVDGDGDLDVLGAAENDNEIAWWENVVGDGSVWEQHGIDLDFKWAESVTAADVDGDGDQDVLGAAHDANEIAWWENVDRAGPGTGDGSAWSKYTVDDTFTGANDVAAADVDGDGDQDILGAGRKAFEIAWWENTAGDSSAWSKHVVYGRDVATSVAAADVDGDGDMDILGTLFTIDTIFWWANMGGQFALDTADTAPTQLTSGQTDDLLEITMTHNGRSGDGDEELTTLELLFEESAGVPLTSAEANAVIGELTIYLDDGSGDFEIGSDTLVATVDSLALTDGVQTVAFADGDANVQVQFGTARAYFVVVELAGDTYTQTAIHQFRIIHITESSSTADDRDHDILLILEYAADVASSSVIVPIARIWDGGGTTNDWSEAANWVDDTLPVDSYDGVYFDNTSSKNASIDAAFDRIPAGVVIASAYTGQITHDADLAVGGDWHQDGGTFTGGSSTLDIAGAFNLSGGAFTAPTGLMRVSGGFHHSGGTFDPNGGRVVLDNTNDQTLATTFHDLYLNDGLLGYWKLDDGSGSTAVDSSGYGHDGTLHNGPAWKTDSPATMDFHDPYALQFDRSEVDYVTIAGTDDIDDLQQFSLATWVKLDTMPAGEIMRFITLGNEKAVLRYDGVNGSGQLHFYVKIDGSLHSIRVNDILSADVWLHVAGTYDGSTMRLYLNGVEVDTNIISGTVDSGDGVVLSHSSVTSALDCLLDDVRIYNRALSGTEINDLADGKHPETAIATTTLGAALDVDGDLTLNSGTLAQPQTGGYWKLDEGAGITAGDSSANGYDGTLQRSPTWSTDTPVVHFSNPYSLAFDRADADYVSIPGTTHIDNMQQISLSTWVRLASTPTGTSFTDMRFISLGHEKAVLRYVDESGAGKLQFYMSIGGSLHSIVVDYPWAIGTWYHMVGTYDGNTMRLYLDGVEVDTKTISGTVDTGDGIHLSWSGGDAALDGLLDDVRVYSRALSASEVQALADGYDVRAQDITIAGDFIRNGGVFEAGGGEVTFDGSSTQTLDTDTITLYDLTVNAGSTLVIQRDISVEGTLTNNGTLQQTKDPVGAGAAYLSYGGYGGVLIADLSGTDPGDTTVSIKGNQDCTDMAGETVQRCFDIAPTITSGLDTLVQFFFVGSELSGNDCNTLNAYHWSGSDWEELTLDTNWGGDGRACESEPYSVRVKDVSDFSAFVLKSSSPCTDPATPTNTSIDLTGANNTDVLLGWYDDSANAGGYEVHRSTSPYFTPDSGSVHKTPPAGSTSTIDEGAAGSISENYTYVIRGIGNCGDVSDFEKRLGEFDFALVPGTGATITVNTTDDELNSDGDCSLREAIQAANTNSAVDACAAGADEDTIIVPADTYTLTLTGKGENGNATGDLDVTSNITIDGDGAASTIIQAGTDASNGIDRVFHVVDSSSDLTLDSVTVRYGNSCDYGGGGGVTNDQGAVTIENSTLSDNYCGYGGGGGISSLYGTVTIKNSTLSGNSTDDSGVGGGVSTWGSTVTIENSTLSDNSAYGEGGGMYTDGGGAVTIENSTISGNASTDDGGGGIANGASMTIRNSTISGNSAAAYGGGMQHNEGTMTIEHSTITGNSASSGNGGGVFSFSALNLSNTIIVGNGPGPNDDCVGSHITSHGYNLVGVGTGCPSDGTGDQTTSDPKLDALADNGGPTYTHALQSDSPALDQIPTGVNGCGTDYTSDQRGETRPQGGMCDVGAFELVATVYAIWDGGGAGN